MIKTNADQTLEGILDTIVRVVDEYNSEEHWENQQEYFKERPRTLPYPKILSVVIDVEVEFPENSVDWDIDDIVCDLEDISHYQYHDQDNPKIGEPVKIITNNHILQQ